MIGSLSWSPSMFKARAGMTAQPMWCVHGFFPQNGHWMMKPIPYERFQKNLREWISTVFLISTVSQPKQRKTSRREHLPKSFQECLTVSILMCLTCSTNMPANALYTWNIYLKHWAFAPKWSYSDIESNVSGSHRSFIPHTSYNRYILLLYYISMCRTGFSSLAEWRFLLNDKCLNDSRNGHLSTAQVWFYIQWQHSLASWFNRGIIFDGCVVSTPKCHFERVKVPCWWNQWKIVVQCSPNQQHFADEITLFTHQITIFSAKNHHVGHLQIPDVPNDCLDEVFVGVSGVYDLPMEAGLLAGG